MTMRSLIRTLCLAMVAFAGYGLVLAQEVKRVKVHVCDHNREVIPGIVLSNTDISSPSLPTDDSGITFVDLPIGAKENELFFLQLVKGWPANEVWFLISVPHKVPSLANSSGSPEWVVLIKKSLRDASNISNYTEEQPRDGLGDTNKLNKSGPNELAQEKNKKKADEGVDEMIRSARSLSLQGKDQESTNVYWQALALRPDDPTIINDLGRALINARNYSAAERLYRRTLAMKENILGSDHLDVATICVTLAGLCYSQGKDREAAEFYKRALEIRDKRLGPEHADVFGILEIYADLLRKTHQENEATIIEARIKTLRAKYTRQDQKQ